MESREQRCKELFNRWYQRQLADTELPELWELLSEADSRGKLEPMMQDAYNQLKEDRLLSPRQIQDMANAITQKQQAVVRSFNFRHWAAAASVVAAVALGGWYFFLNKKDAPAETVQATLPHDVLPPQTNKAAITLADGGMVYLDSASNGQLAQQGNIKLVKLADGQIAYESATGDPDSYRDVKEIQYNTLSNPRGSKVIDMTLSDGSHVWLNAGSSVTYPVAFAGNERKVSITGEAYFEIAHNASKPFYVSKGEMRIQVLGTHFNVNAYDDESDIKITLLEGAVKVSNGNSEGFLKPGQQAQVTNSVRVVSNVDVETVMAWKNGLFAFDGYEDINAIMRQLSRWYNVEVEYKGKVTTMFGGSISRSENVSQVLRMLEATGGVSFKVEDRKVIVIPAK